jgi:hypothetical protein
MNESTNPEPPKVDDPDAPARDEDPDEASIDPPPKTGVPGDDEPDSDT